MSISYMPASEELSPTSKRALDEETRRVIEALSIPQIEQGGDQREITERAFREGIRGLTARGIKELLAAVVYFSAEDGEAGPEFDDTKLQARVAYRNVLIELGIKTRIDFEIDREGKKREHSWVHKVLSHRVTDSSLMNTHALMITGGGSIMGPRAHKPTPGSARKFRTGIPYSFIGDTFFGQLDPMAFEERLTSGWRLALAESCHIKTREELLNTSIFNIDIDRAISRCLRARNEDPLERILCKRRFELAASRRADGTGEKGSIGRLIFADLIFPLPSLQSPLPSPPGPDLSLPDQDI